MAGRCEQEGPKMLFNLSREKSLELRKLIESCQGRGWLMVHPYYYDPRVQKLDDYYPHLQKVLKNTNQRAAPLFILEEYLGIKETRRRIMEEASEIMRGRTYIIRTEDGNPYPYFPRERLSREERWGKVAEKLKSFGVRKLFVGGQCLEIKSCWGKPEYDLCVGWTVEGLNPFLDVVLTSITWPDKPLRR